MYRKIITKIAVAFFALTFAEWNDSSANKQEDDKKTGRNGGFQRRSGGCQFGNQGSA